MSTILREARSKKNFNQKNTKKNTETFDGVPKTVLVIMLRMLVWQGRWIVYIQ